MFYDSESIVNCKHTVESTYKQKWEKQTKEAHIIYLSSVDPCLVNRWFDEQFEGYFFHRK